MNTLKRRGPNTDPTGNLRSVFLVFFPHLLKFSPVFPRDLERTSKGEGKTPEYNNNNNM
jgi:hypothetical protein